MRKREGADHAGRKMGLELRHVAGAREFAVARKPSRQDLLDRLRAYRGRLPADFTFDRDEANDR
jgi:antitoxin MazE